jgi:CelD/BcsL family acetyltransferase involved in cellulose biosynthesis
MTVPESVNALFGRWGRKERHNFRNAENKLSRTYNGQVAFRCFQDEKDADCFISHAEQIARKTYQRALGVGFRDDVLNHSLIRLAGRRGWLLSHILYIENRPVSFQAAIRYGDTLFIEDIGYDPDFRSDHPGKNLFLKVATTLCGSADIRYIDFGFGHSRYKQSLCDHSWNESSVYLFPQTIGGTAAQALVAGDLLVSKVLTRLMEGTRLQERIKTTWRSRLQKQSE